MEAAEKTKTAACMLAVELKNDADGRNAEFHTCEMLRCG